MERSVKDNNKESSDRKAVYQEIAQFMISIK